MRKRPSSKGRLPYPADLPDVLYGVASGVLATINLDGVILCIFTVHRGGNIIKNDAGSYDMWVSEMVGKDCGLNTWLSNSRIVHVRSCPQRIPSPPPPHPPLQAIATLGRGCGVCDLTYSIQRCAHALSLLRSNVCLALCARFQRADRFDNARQRMQLNTRAHTHTHTRARAHTHTPGHR